MRSTLHPKEDEGVKDNSVLTNKALQVVKQSTTGKMQPNERNNIIQQEYSLKGSESYGTLPLN